MEKLVNYKNWVKKLLVAYANEGAKDGSEVEEQLLFDDERGHYQLLALGWERGRRVFFCILHLDLKNGKIWLQENSTDFDIVEELMALGVPASDIVIGFHPADVREMTEFAVA